MWFRHSESSLGTSPPVNLASYPRYFIVLVNLKLKGETVKHYSDHGGEAVTMQCSNLPLILFLLRIHFDLMVLHL